MVMMTMMLAMMLAMMVMMAMVMTMMAMVKTVMMKVDTSGIRQSTRLPEGGHQHRRAPGPSGCWLPPR